MDTLEQVEKLINQLKQLNFPSIRSYSTDNKSIINICSIDAIKNVQASQKINEIKQIYNQFTQTYTQQIGIRGDGNCFYRSVMLMIILNYASNEDTNEFENFIKAILCLRDIRLDYANSININTEDLQLIFGVFLMRILAWRKQQVKVDIGMIINEYNSLPEVDFAACTITRFVIYQTFKQFQNHPEMKAFIDEEVKEHIAKILLKQNEYAEGVIIPLTAQAFQCELVIQNLYQEQGQYAKVNSEKLVYKPLILSAVNQQKQKKQIHLLFTKDHYDAFVLGEDQNRNPQFYQIQPTRFTSMYQNTNAYSNFLLHQKFKLQSMSNSQIQPNMTSSQMQSNQSLFKNQTDSKIVANNINLQQNNKLTNANYPSEAPIFIYNNKNQQESQAKQQSNQTPQQIQIQSKSISEPNNYQTGDSIPNPQLNQQNIQNITSPTNINSSKNAPTYTKYPSFNELSQSQIQPNRNADQNADQVKCVSCNKRILSFSEYSQIRNVNTQKIEKICKNCNQKISKSNNSNVMSVIVNQEMYEYILDTQKSKLQLLLSQNGQQQQATDQNIQTNSAVQNNQNNNNQKQQPQHQHVRASSLHSASTQPMQSQNIPLKQTQSQVSQVETIKNNGFDFNFGSISNQEPQLNLQQRNEIPLMGSAFMIDQFSELQTNQQQKNSSNKAQSMKLALSSKSQSFKKSQVVPIIQYQSDDEDNALVCDDEDDNDIFNKKSRNNSPINQKSSKIITQNKNDKKTEEKKDSKEEKKIDITKCIKCKLPFKTTKYIIKGKKLALLCAECLESMQKDLKKDQKSIVIEGETYKFGESIIAKIKEQSLIEKEIKKDNVIIPKMIPNQQKSISAPIQQSNHNSNLSQTQNNLNHNSSLSQSQNNRNQINNLSQSQNNQLLSQGNQLCNQCNKMVTSTYEVHLVQKSGVQESQRVCQDCVSIFVLYYEHPNKFIKFGGNTYLTSDLFGKYLYYQQLSQVKGQVQQERQVQRKKAQDPKKCIVCNTKCNEILPIIDQTQPQVKCYIGHNCFYLNLSCIQDNQFFIYNGKTYLLDKEMQILAYQHLVVQVDLYSKQSAY